YRELRSSLAGRGARFQTSSDTEVLLRLYEVEGERCVERLDGMFAFAVWDGRRQRLFLARDRVGKKPLFYCSTPGLFAFASEIKALLCHPSVPCEILPSSLPHYFFFGYSPSPHTFYRNIFEIPPAHTLTVDAVGRMELKGYWDLNFNGQSAKDLSIIEAASRVRDLLTEAVRKRLVADVPLGAFLSGGIDSSIVVGLMSQMSQEPVKTFSIGFAGDKSFDETEYARLVASHFRTHHTEFIVEPKAIDLIEPLVWHHDGPFGDSSAIPTFLVAQLTRKQVTVALNGDGGDELFAGYLRFYAAVLAERIPGLLLLAGEKTLSAIPEYANYPHWLRRAQRFLRGASCPFFERFSRWVSYFNDDLSLLLRKEI
ncbi:MAG: asparagine synthase (glutamine-hydrolyzing), partial [Planctomycetota bacterium]|nr:asparagine synthase (glutamine-hydrolyzing) [Planctomycetota bacterium]